MSYFVLPSCVVYYLNVSFNRFIISVGPEKAGFPAIDYSLFCCFCSKVFPLHLSARERLYYFIDALPGPSIL